MTHNALLSRNLENIVFNNNKSSKCIIRTYTFRTLLYLFYLRIISNLMLCVCHKLPEPYRQVFYNLQEQVFLLPE